ncbi:MAG: rhombosortase [Candidatus Electrothrix sp. YB6]
MSIGTDSNRGCTGIPLLTCSLCAAYLLLFLLFGPAPEALVYNRAAIAQGELWRLVSGHFVHCDRQHLVWNLLPLLLISGLLEQRIGWLRCAGLTGLSCLGISFWLYFGQTDLLRYCGLSGILNSLFAVLLARLWQEHRHPVVLLIGLAAIIKIAIEIMQQQAVFTHLSWGSVPEAHGAGMVVGVAVVLYAESRSAGLSATGLSFNPGVMRTR